MLSCYKQCIERIIRLMLAVNKVRKNCFKLISFDLIFASLVGQIFKFYIQELSAFVRHK